LIPVFKNLNSESMFNFTKLFSSSSGGAPPAADGKPACTFYAQGKCKHGSSCKFSHQALQENEQDSFDAQVQPPMAGAPAHYGHTHESSAAPTSQGAPHSQHQQQPTHQTAQHPQQQPCRAELAKLGIVRYGEWNTRLILPIRLVQIWF
jgi:hypothetical protein